MKKNIEEIKMSEVIGINYWFKGARLPDSQRVDDGALSPLNDAQALTDHLASINKANKGADFTSIRVAFVADSTLLKDSAQYDAFAAFVENRDWNISNTLNVRKEEQTCYVNPKTNVRSHSIFLSPKIELTRTKL